MCKTVHRGKCMAPDAFFGLKKKKEKKEKTKQWVKNSIKETWKWDNPTERTETDLTEMKADPIK